MSINALFFAFVWTRFGAPVLFISTPFLLLLMTAAEEMGVETTHCIFMSWSFFLHTTPLLSLPIGISYQSCNHPRKAFARWNYRDLKKHSTVYCSSAGTTAVLFCSCNYRSRWFHRANKDPPIYSVNGGWKRKQKLDMKMPKFREARKELIYVQCDSLIKDEKLFSSKRS